MQHKPPANHPIIWENKIKGKDRNGARKIFISQILWLFDLYGGRQASMICFIDN